MLYPLSLLKPLQSARIVQVADAADRSVRLRDLGFEPGAPVSCLLQKKRGAISAFLIKGAVIALRREDASLIFVSETEEACL